MPLLLGVELIDQGKIDRTYGELHDNYLDCLREFWSLGSGENYTPIRDKSVFFPEIANNPQKYIIPQPEMVDVLNKLRKQGKFLFLATNAPPEFAELLMTTTLGPNWKECFDMIFAACGKPNFFSYEKELKMRRISYEAKDFCGDFVTSFDQLSEEQGNNLFQGGSVALLDQYLQNKLQKQVVKFAYFGDFYINDIYWSAKNENWDGFVVIEELSFREEEFAAIQKACPLPPIDMKLPKIAKDLGDYFIHDH